MFLTHRLAMMLGKVISCKSLPGDFSEAEFGKCPLCLLTPHLDITELSDFFRLFSIANHLSFGETAVEKGENFYCDRNHL